MILPAIALGFGFFYSTVWLCSVYHSNYMNGDPEQNVEHPKNQHTPENKMQSIRELNEAIKDGDEKYIDRLNVIADLLSDLNTIFERLVDLAIQIRDSLKKG